VYVYIKEKDRAPSPAASDQYETLKMLTVEPTVAEGRASQRLKGLNTPPP
jgi:hypothetical protein